MRLGAFLQLRYYIFYNLFISDNSFNSINSELCGAELSLACMPDEIRATETFQNEDFDRLAICSRFVFIPGLIGSSLVVSFF